MSPNTTLIIGKNMVWFLKRLQDDKFLKKILRQSQIKLILGLLATRIIDSTGFNNFIVFIN